MRIHSILFASACAVFLLVSSSEAQTWKELSVQAESLAARGLVDSANILAQKSLLLAEKKFGRVDTDVARILFGLGLLNARSAFPGKKYFVESLDIRRTLLPENHPDIGRVLTHLGRFFYGEDDKKAESILREAVAIFRSSASPDTSYLAQALMYLGSALVNQAHHSEARALFEEGLQILQIHNPKTPQISIALTNLGIVSEYLLRKDDAESYFQKAVQFNENHPDTLPFTLGRILMNYGVLLQMHGKPLGALPVMLRADSIFQKLRDSSWIAINLANLGSVYVDLHSYDRAKEILQQTLIISMHIGNDLRKQIQTLQALAAIHVIKEELLLADSLYAISAHLAQRLYGREDLRAISSEAASIPVLRKLHRFAEPSDIALRLVTAQRENLIYNMAELSDREALAYSGYLKSDLDILLSIFFENDSTSDRIIVKTVEACLASKGQISEVIMERENLLSSRHDSSFAKISSRLKTTKAEVARTYASTSLRTGVVDSLSKIVQQLEITLGRLSKTFELEKNLKSDLVKRMALFMPRSAALVEYVKYSFLPTDSGKQIPRYAAIAFADGGTPLLKDLGEADKIDKLIDLYRQHFLKLAILTDYNATAMQRLSSEKVFALNTSPGEVAATRNVRSNCEALNETKVSRLPSTKAEVDAIADYFPSSNVFVGRTASEENFKKNATGRKAIHIATHGYFISEECEEQLGKKSNTQPVGGQAFVGENPLLQSGLLLAGANLHGSDIKNDEADGGIVTALELSAMDLRGVDLVVLSACETGLGKVEQGEGVYGLRRAVQMAGAKTVVSSLWQVQDKETTKFMRELYARMSATNKAKSARVGTYPELMQKVALERITELRDRGRPTHPYTWGGFIATGDWRIK